MKFNLKRLIIPLILAAISFAVVIGIESRQDKKNPAADIKPEISKVKVAKKKPKPIPIEERFPHIISRNVALYTYLREQQIPSLDIVEMANASKSVRNLSRVQAGTRFRFIQNDDQTLKEIEFRFSPLERMLVKKNESSIWEAKLIEEKVDIHTVTFAGEVQATLWESALNAKMDPTLIIELAEIFGWEVDFAREVQVGDRWRIVVEQKKVKGVHMGWGSILAAEYENVGKSHRAVLFKLEDKIIGYYTPEGESLRKMFLKSPLKFARVTSRFNRRRFHPKLKVVRPHNGVDYGAPIGTPVLSVADGTVIFSQFSGGGGNVLKIRHNSTYQTAYKHLHRFARGVRRGAKVKQGQVVAYVGNTGLSTGPHLHYEFFVNGRYVDPLRQKFPSADPVASEHMDTFKLQSQIMLASLPKWDGQPADIQETPVVKSWAHEWMPYVHAHPYYQGPTVND